MKKMFTKCMAVYLLISALNLIGQVSVKRLNDPAIVAQHKRMVFQSWGDFRPYPKYLLGIQTNFAYATVWGLWAPKINRDYKDGEDIRPLKPNGLQNQRFAKLKFQELETQKIKAASDTIYKRSVQDLAHWTSSTVDADPLWLLYYKRMLRPVSDFPDHPQNFVDWQLPNHYTFETLTAMGTLSRLQKELDLIKEKYAISRSVDMPRGKRFVMYHQILIKWRRFKRELEGYHKRVILLSKYRNIFKNHSDFSFSSSGVSASDRQIVHHMMLRFKHKF